LAGLLAFGTVFPMADLARADGTSTVSTAPADTESGFEISVSSVEDLTGLTAVIAGGGEGVNLRSNPDQDADVLVSVPDGATVALRVDMVDTVLDSDGVTRWWPVSFEGQDGWISGFYLIDSASQSEPAVATASVDTSTSVVPTDAGEPFDFTEQATESSTARIAGSGESVNVRAEATVDSEVVAIAADGQIVTLRIVNVDTVLDSDGVTRWWPITIAGVDGWVSGFYLIDSASQAEPEVATASVDTSTAVVPTDAGEPFDFTEQASESSTARIAGSGESVNVRAEATVDSEVVAIAADGQIVTLRIADVDTVLDSDGVTRWWPITIAGVDGWVSGFYLTSSDGVATTAPVSTAVVTPTTPAAPASGEFAAGDDVAVRSVSGAGVNVRESATMTSDIVGFRADNSILRVTDGPMLDEEGDAWYRVSDGDLTGWIVADLLISSVAPTDGTDGTAAQPTVTPAATATATATATDPAESTSTFSYPLTTYTRTQGFGCSSLGFYPFNADFGCNVHDGLDLAAPSGTPILAAGSGTVVTAGWCDCGLGYYVEIDHGDGLHTLYGHMAEQPFVSAGQQVNRGDVIGPVGATGVATGPHVHFMVRVDGVAQDPENYLP